MKRYAKIFSVVFTLITIATSAVAQSLYSYRASGVWDNPYSWTIVSGGLQYQNDENLYPAKDGVATYRATISENRTMTFNGSEDIQLASLDVKGTLILEGERSILVDNLTGKGEIQLKSFEQLKVKDSEGVYRPISSFAGTISLNGTVSLNAVGNTYNFANIVVQTGVTTITGMLSVSNNVTIKGAGTLMFADASGNELTIGGDLLINTGGQINATGTNENVLIVKGNTTNNGIIGAGGAVDVSGIVVNVTDEQVKTELEKMGVFEPEAPYDPVADTESRYTQKTEPEVTSFGALTKNNTNRTPVIFSNSNLEYINEGAVLTLNWTTTSNRNSIAIQDGIGNIIKNDDSNLANKANGNLIVTLDAGQAAKIRTSGIRVAYSNVDRSSISLSVSNYISYDATVKYGGYVAAVKEYNEVLYPSYLVECGPYQSKFNEKKSEMEGEERQRLMEEAINNAAASSCYITVSFTGSKDAVFRNNGTAKFYRIRGQKDKNRRIEIINTRDAENLKVVAQSVSTDSKKITDYRDLPWSVSSGILSLGDGVRIDTWGVPFVKTNNGGARDLAEYVNTENGCALYIPQGAELEIAGANVSVGRTGNGTSTEQSGAVLVAGTLRIKSGELSLPNYSPGILFVSSSSSSKLYVEGGIINTTRIGVYNHQPAVVNISDGTVNFNRELSSVGDYNNRSLYLSKGSQFIMSGGVVDFSSTANFEGTKKEINGIWMSDDSSTSYGQIAFSVTGGEIRISTPSTESFNIFAPGVVFNDLIIGNNSKVKINNIGSDWQASTTLDPIVKLHDLTVGNNSALDLTWSRFVVSGDVTIGSGVDFDSPDGGLSTGRRESARREVVFTGSTNTTYSSASGQNVCWSNVLIQKPAGSKLSVPEGSTLHLSGKLVGDFGSLEGVVSLSGTSMQSIYDNSEECFKNVKLHVNNTAGVQLETNSQMNIVEFDKKARFSLLANNLKLDNFPKKNVSNSWASDFMFYTNNSASAGGITVPIPAAVNDDNRVHIGIYNDSYYLYSYAKPRYTNSDASNIKYFTVAPVHGIQPQLDTDRTTFNFYWSIKSDIQATRIMDLFDLKVENLNNNVCSTSLLGVLWGQKRVIISESGAHEAGAEVRLYRDNAGSTYTFKSSSYQVDGQTVYVTDGDYCFSKEAFLGLIGGTSMGNTYYATVNNGEWSGNIWKKNNEGSLVAGTSIGAKDGLIIPEGITVKRTNTTAVKGGILTIHGKLEVNQNATSNISIREFAGDGTLQYNYSSGAGSLINADYSAFCTNDKARFVCNLTGDVSEWSWSLKEMPNFTVKSGDGSSHEFGWKLNGGGKNVLSFNGTLEVGGQITFIPSTSDDAYFTLTAKKEVKVGSDAQFVIGKETANVSYYFNGVITNNGSILDDGYNNEVSIYTDIVNNGKIDLSSCNVSVLGDSQTKISGTAITKGNTNLGILHLNKSMGSRGITTTLPLGNAEGLAQLFIDCGLFKHQYSGDLITYKGDECFYIPAGSKFSLEAGSVRFYVAEPTDDDCPRVKLSGEIEVAENTTLDNLGGVGYTSGSKFIINKSGTVNAAFLSPFSGDADIKFTMSNKSVLNLGPSNPYRTSDEFGVFDIRYGSDVTVGGGGIRITNTALNTDNPTIYYHPSVSSFNKAVAITISTPALKNCRIDATETVGQLFIGGVSETRVLIDNNPLTVSALSITNGNFFCCGNDLTIEDRKYAMDVSAEGYFSVGDVEGNNSDINTVTILNNTSEEQKISSVKDLTLNNFVFNGQSLIINRDMILNGDLHVDNGDISSSRKIHSKGDVYVNSGASISQGTLIMESDSHEQGLYCEGEIASLYINNQFDVLANSQQAKPITITKELQFQKGRLIIGGNMLDIKNINEKCGITKAKSVQFGPDMMIATNNSFTDRGVRLNFNAGETANMTIPLGSGSKYAPFILNGVTAESSGNITVVANNSVHTSIKNSDPSKTRFLKYYWMVTASSGFRISSGSFDMQDDVNDAVGFDECKTGAESSHPYVTCFLNSNTGDLTPATGTVSLIDDNLNLEFSDIKGKDVNGIYTAGCRDDIPTEGVPTYISISSGAWSGEPIWKRYNRSDGTYIGDAMQVENKSGCRFIVDHDVTLHPSNDPSAPELGDSFLNIFALEVRENGVVDFNGTENNNLGIVTGTGKIIFRSGDIPGANYDGFFGADGGTVEYSSKGVASDYNVFVGYPYHNNVIFSGKGKRFLPTSNVVTIHGNVTVKDEAELVLGGKDVVLEKNLTFESADATTSGDGAFIFSGSVSQNLSVAEPMYLAGIGVNNTLGVMVNDDITVDNLTLTEGCIIMAGDKILRMHDASSTVNIKNSNSYVDGWFSCYAESGKYIVFPVGNGTRSASTDVYATSSGFWKVRYHNRPYTTDGAVIDKIKSDVGISIDGIGNEYWEVDGPANAKIRLRWDELSNVQDVSTLRVITQRNATPDWKYITYSRGKYDEYTGVLVTASQTSMVGAGPRIFLLSTSAETASFEWLGGISSSWSEKGNWSKDAIPTLTSDIIIRPVGDGAFALVVDDNIEGKRANANSIIIEPGAVMTLRGAGTTLNVKTNLTIQTGGQMKVVYDADANPNFYVQGTISGDVNVERVIRAGRKYYTGSATTERLIIPGDGWDESYVYIRKYDHPNYKFVNPGKSGDKYYFDRHAAYEGETNSLAESLNTFGILSGTGSKGTVVAGYKYSFFQEGTVSNATKTYTLNAYQGSNWYSNPYPFSLKMSKDVIRVSRPLSGDKVEKTIYTYESMDDDGSFAARSYNFSTGASTSGFEALAPFQGFEILCQDRNKVFNSNNVQSQLELSPVLYTWTDDEKNVMLKSSTIDPLQGNILRLFAGNDLGADEVVLLLNDEGSMEMVPGDSEKKANSAPAKFNQISTHKGDVSLVITHMPSVNELIGMGVTLPINLYKATNANDLSVWIKNIDEFNFTGNIYLVDNLAGVKFNLTLDGEYNCPEVDNLYAGRFELAFEPSEEEIVTPPTAIEVTNSDIERIRIWVESEEKARVTIFGNVEDNARAVVFDIMGREIISQSLTNRVSQIAMPSKGVYVVDVINGKTSKSEKLVL